MTDKSRKAVNRNSQKPGTGAFRRARLSRALTRSMLLAGTSLATLTFAVPSAYAIKIGGGNASATTAETVAAAAAQQAASQAQQAAQKASRSMARAIQSLQTTQALQAAARAAAQAQQSSTSLGVNVPNGLGAGGLDPAAGWSGANGPTQTVNGGRTNVNIDQTQQQAILNWKTFNVGTQTTLEFDQHGNTNWVALNRVDATTGPSQILGNMKADGQVYVINQSGIIFGGASQINVGALIASTANMTDQQFLNKGIYSTQAGTTYLPSFTGATGKIIVESGAQITTNAPASVTSGGGYVLLMGSEVTNAGSISTPKGQTVLAAGQDFVLRKGFGTDANQNSSTVGIEISPFIAVGSSSGTVTNAGLIFSQQGDITMAGHTVLQDGILLSTTSVNQRGTIHLLNSATDTDGSVALTGDSLTAILPELDSTDTALNVKRDALIAASGGNLLATGQFDNLSALVDRKDRSRVEIVTGGTANFEDNSLTLAQGGDVSVSAGKRVFTQAGATIDVSGVQGVMLPADANMVLVNIQGNELRDSPQNRDSGNLLNSDVWVDARDLIFVPAGTGGYATDRYYTAGGLLEVSGYVGNTAHTIGEWTAVGGTITLNAPEVVAQKGSIFNISGGSVQYQSGYVSQTLLLGSDGRLYGIDDAPAYLSYKAVADGFVVDHTRAGIIEVYHDLGGNKNLRWEQGYTAGRDAGQLVLSTPTGVFEGDIVANVITGERQTATHATGPIDGYKSGQTAAPLAGQLIVGKYGNLGYAGGYNSDIKIGDVASITEGMSADSALPNDRANTVYLDATHLTAQNLGGLNLTSTDQIAVDAPVSFVPGAQITFAAPNITIGANITAHGGTVNLGNYINILAEQGQPLLPVALTDPDGKAQVTIDDNSTIDLGGLWVNQRDGSPPDFSALGFLNGGTFSVDTTGGINFAAGSTIDVSSGGAILANGKTQGGKGGNASLITNDYSHLSQVDFYAADRTAPLIVDGKFIAYGFIGGGTLTLNGPQKVLIGDGAAAPGEVHLDTSLFSSGFSNYDITAADGITIADGTQIAPVVPVYRFTGGGVGSGSNVPVELWQPPVSLADPFTQTVTQRVGADLTLVTTRGDFTLGSNASITVDPGHSVNIYAYGQTTIDGDITARGGNILIAGATERGQTDQIRRLGGPGGFSLTRSIWIGDDATLDVTGYAATASDTQGRSFGSVANGGSIQLGGAGSDASDAFVIIRPGAVLDASGTSAVIDVQNGGQSTPTLVASDGGLIALNSNNGIYIDGTLRAAAGGAGASGGTLSMNLVSRTYVPSTSTAPASDDSIGVVPDALRKLRNITITQQREASGLGSDAQAGQADAGLLIGSAAISADQIVQGGFGSLALKTADLFVFKGDINLSLPRSLTLSGGLLTVSDATPNIAVALAAPYVKIDGFTEQKAGDGFYSASLNGVLPSLKLNASTFSVAADLLDITGGVRFGAYGHQGSGWLSWGPNLPDRIADGTTSDGNSTSGGDIVDAAGFAQVSLTSRGDIRFGNGITATGPGVTPSGWLKTGGDLTLTAAQIYPMSDASVSIYAGLVALRNNTGGVQGNEGFDPAQPKTITIRRSSGDMPQQPASVFGRLTLTAGIIDQGGVIRAPLGIVGFNIPGAVFVTPNVTSVIFRAGSVTATSAKGLVMPFGGTSDGTSYQGADGTLVDLASALVATSGNPRIATGLSVAGTSVVGEPGALLDLSGGGDLTGAGFVTGRGGSVDTLKTPLVNSNPAYGNISAEGNQVYAIMPGYASAYAPLLASNGAGDPAIGQQVTIPAGVPGLPAGTYTLLPSSYALLPGAFRIELGAATNRVLAPIGQPNGSYLTSGLLGVANAGIQNSLPTQIILTAGQTVRTYSQYNETSYTDFARSQAALFGNVRPRLPIDGGILQFSLGASDGVTRSLSFAGTANFDPAGDGIAGSLLITSSALNGIIDITASGAAPIIGHSSVSSDDLNAFHAASLFVGGADIYTPAGNTGGGSVSLVPVIVGTNSAVNILDGAELRAGQVFLVSQSISVAGGAIIDTRGQSTAGLDSSFGYVFNGGNFLAVANGWLNFLPATGTGTSMTIASGASLLTEGSIVLGAPGSLSMGDVNFGARYLTVTQDTINAGDAAELAAAQAAGVLPTGWALSQTTLDRLLRPSSTAGVPALERLTLTAGGSINLFGSVTLDARSQSANGVEFVLNTPAIYGLGTSADTATIVADRLVWNGIRTGSVNNTTGVPNYANKAPAAIRPNGAGTGAGNLVVQAQNITFGYDEDSRPTDGITLDRIAVGFANVAMNAGSRITGNSDGTLSVGQSKNASGALVGGNLTLTSPLITAEAGSTIDYKAGGVIRVAAPAGVAPTDTAVVADLGGTLSFNGDSVFVDTAFALPSGKLTLTAVNDVIIGSNAKIDLAGRTVAFYDVNKYGWGGDLVMQSAHGSIAQNAGSLIDVSATYNQAGSIIAIADDGQIALNGTLRGSAVLDSQSGRIGVRAQSLGDFAALNAMLNETGFFGSRAFVLRQGDLTVGSDVRAHVVSISVDNGSLTVNGTIDASGAAPGSIRLAARDDLTLASSAVLDTHSTQLQTDSYGAPIEANNTAHVDLTTSQGWVTLMPGATIDMSTPDQTHAYGKLEINAPRLGSGGSATGAGAPDNATGNDIAISAAGPLDIRGAGSIAVNGFSTYTNAPADPDDTNGQVIDQAWLDLIHQDSTVFYNSALANTDLQNRLAGLKAYGSAFHLRPGVTIASATPDGNLTTKGDLDFSNYRYGPGADAVNHTGIGEVGVVNFRAGGTLTVKGSINDGFAPPPVSPDALTTLLSGFLTEDYTVTTAGVVLSAGWMIGGTFDDTAPAFTLPVALPLGQNFYFAWEPTENHPLPIDIPLAQDFTIGGFGGTLLGGEIRAADGHVLYHATDEVPVGAVIPAGSVLGAGIHDIGGWSGVYTTLTEWPANTDLTVLAGSIIPQAVTLPAGTVLPVYFSLTDITLTGPGDRKVWATSAMLTPGAQSWSMRLVGGADLTSADSRALQATTRLAAGAGNVVLSDPFNINLTGTGTSSAGVSVVRTGTGNLEILAGGSYRQDSPYGVYTAGTQIAVDDQFNTGRALASDGTVLGSISNPQNAGYEDTLKDAAGNYLPRMYYTENGGDFLLTAQGDIGGDLRPNDSTTIGNWLWRQGGAELGQATAWGINFGSYVGNIDGLGPQLGLDAFSGMGALGGGNVTLRAGGDIGNAGQGIVVAVGGSGRVMADGTLVQTGGGTLTVEAGRNVGTGGNQFVNLRGDTAVAVGNFGSITAFVYGYNGIDPRPIDPLKSLNMTAIAGGSFAPGDGTITVRTRGDLAMGTIDDPGRVGLGQETAGGTDGVQGATWFTLWTGRTVVDLTAAGGDASPLSADQSTAILPSVLRVAAASGSIFLNPALYGASLMMPSPDGELQLLARGSVIQDYRRGSAFGPLSTSIASIATPFNPAWVSESLVGGNYVVQDSNLWAQGDQLRDQVGATATGTQAIGRLFAFGPDTISDASAASTGVKSLIYAVNGDISGLRYGEVYVDTQLVGSGYVNTNYYRAAKPVDIMAGGDIVNLGGLILHADPTDISTIAAGGNVIYAGINNTAGVGLQIAGPGTLEVTAGKTIYQGSLASIESIGAKVSGDTRPGASIVLQAGVGAGAPGEGQVDWAGFAKLYLDPANLAGSGPLADQPGKVAKTYNSELMGWLKTRFGYAGSADDALAYFLALPAEQQRVFLRIVYYAELTAGGREFSDTNGPRTGSYLRGREAIAALFPHEGAYAGDITMFSATAANTSKVVSGSVHTDFGGDIQFLAPGGQVVVGTEGLAPGADAGLVTQGGGDIQMYSQKSILLGLSRIMTTFGGDILAWSDTGDINAGRGSKTTVVFTPPRLVYDNYGNISLAPVAPSTGAGIATLNPIPEVPSGDIDLIAPQGTIDAGEAGIRFSGDLNIVAPNIVNAANITGAGKTTGIPTVQGPPVAALTTAANTAGANQQTGAPTQSNSGQASVMIVEIIGYGGSQGSDDSNDDNRRKQQ